MRSLVYCHRIFNVGRCPASRFKHRKIPTNYSGIGVGAKVEAKLKDKTTVKGTIESVAADSFTVTESKTGASRVVAFADITSVKKTRTGLKPRTRAIIAGAAATAVIVGVTVLYPVLCDGGAGC